VLGYGSIITADFIGRNLQQGLSFPAELTDELENNIRSADKDLFLKNYSRLIGILRHYIYQDVVSVLLQVISRCINTMNSISSENIPIKVDFDEFNLIFSSLHTLDHTINWFSHMFDEYLLAIQNIEALKSEKYHQLTRQLQQYVQEHYSDPNLNVESLADTFGYTANYTSKIFKSLTGLYLRDYIKDVRIQRAKEMLKNTNHSIHEISAMSGFSNYNYFFSSFRKESGLTPTGFRSRFIISAR
jgi:YesN/AraC family two-component response regulator